KNGQRVVQKDLTPNPKKPQTLLHVNEVQVPLNFLDCSSITRVLAVVWDGRKASIFQEYAGPSLREAMQDPQHRSRLQQASQTKEVMLGLFKALEKLCIHGIKHRDVKPENTCWDPETGQVRLIDFASCRTPQDKQEASFAGITPEYLPPVVSEGICKRIAPVLTEKSDVWGAAMVALYIIKAGHPVIQFFANVPEYPRDADPQLREVVLGMYGRLRAPLPDFFLRHPTRPDMEVLLRGCLALDEGDRWTSQQAVNFLQGKLSPEGSPARKYRKLNSSFNIENVLDKANPGKIEDLDLSQSVSIRSGKTEGTASVLAANNPVALPDVCGGFKLKAAQLFPPRSQLVTALTPRAQPSMPDKLNHSAQPLMHDKLNHSAQPSMPDTLNRPAQPPMPDVEPLSPTTDVRHVEPPSPTSVSMGG
ncbi:hypothetical protein EGW08_013392, partial [Elysia chlorotica]